MRQHRLALALALAIGCSAVPARAEPNPAFDNMITGLGYEITAETDKAWGYFTAGDYPVNYYYSGDRTVVILTISSSVTPEQSAKLPALDLLKANAELTSAFQTKGTAALTTNVALSRYFLLAGLTPVGLRQQVDALVSDAKEYKALLDPSNWK